MRFFGHGMGSVGERNRKVRARRFFVFVMHNRGQSYREIGQMIGCGPARAADIGHRGEREFWFVCHRLDRGTQNRLDKELLYGVTLTYEAGVDLPVAS